MSTERWLPIAEFSGYEVSDLGNVRGPKGPKSAHCSKGYLRVFFHRQGRSFARMVHLLVMRTFKGPPRGRIVNHKNGHKDDPVLTNLEYTTHQKNSQHAVAHGLCRPRRGESHAAALLRERDILPIFRAVAFGESRRNVAKRYGVGRSVIDSVILRLHWKHVDVPADLIARAKEKGRHANAGEQNKNARLNSSKVLEIFRRAKAGQKLDAIALEVGVSRSLVSMVLNRTVWSHVPIPPEMIPRRTASGRISFVR